MTIKVGVFGSRMFIERKLQNDMSSLCEFYKLIIKCLNRHYMESLSHYDTIAIIIGASFPVNMLMYHFYNQFNNVKNVNIFDTNKTIVMDSLPLNISIQYYTEDEFQPWHIQKRNEKIANMIDTGIVLTTKNSTDVFSVSIYNRLKTFNKSPIYVTV